MNWSCLNNQQRDALSPIALLTEFRSPSFNVAPVTTHKARLAEGDRCSGPHIDKNGQFLPFGETQLEVDSPEEDVVSRAEFVEQLGGAGVGQQFGDIWGQTVADLGRPKSEINKMSWAVQNAVRLRFRMACRLFLIRSITMALTSGPE